MASTRRIEGAPTATVLARLGNDPKADPERDMPVLAALEGPHALAGYLDNHATPRRPEGAAGEAKDREPLGAYLKAITVPASRWSWAATAPARALATGSSTS